MAADDRYTYPGSGGVLINKLGLTTQEGVDEAMNEAASLYWVDLRLEPIPDVLDLDYLRMIHRRLLSPVVEWAGELRQAGDEVIAGDTGIVYAMSAFFRNGLDDVFAQLAGEDYLTGLGADEFTEKLADRWGYLTATHPFRDGNTRSQTAYVDRLAVRAGHPIAWETIDVEELRTARLRAVSGSSRPLAEVLRANLATSQSVVSGDPFSHLKRIVQTFPTRTTSVSNPPPRNRRSDGTGPHQSGGLHL